MKQLIINKHIELTFDSRIKAGIEPANWLDTRLVFFPALETKVIVFNWRLMTFNVWLRFLMFDFGLHYSRRKASRPRIPISDTQNQ